MREPPRLRSVPQPSRPAGPLESWKEIASYLNRTVRTARRWEESEGLPVHRHLHQKRDSVFAYPAELDEWWEQRRARLESAGPSGHRWKAWGGRRAWIVMGAVVALAGAAVAAWVLWTARRPALAFASRDWILVADFTNRTGEAIFDDSLTTAFTVSLQQSAHCNVLPPARVSDALRRMGKDPESRIDEALGREVCLRENVKGLVVAELTRAGKRYALSVKLVDPQTDEAVRVYLESCEGQDGILPALAMIARKVRGDLGESLAAIRRNDRPLPQVTTSSLQALQLYAEGRQRWRSGDYREAVRLYKAALELDPDFVMAHAALGAAYSGHIFSNPESGRKHYEAALKSADRITARERALLSAAYQRDSGNAEEAERLYRLYLQQYPGDTGVRYDLGSSLMRNNRPREAITELQEAVRLVPNYASAYVNLATSHNFLDEPNEALKYYAKAFELYPGWMKQATLSHEYGFTLARVGRLPEAREVFDRTAGAAETRAFGLRSVGLLDLYEGKYRSADERLKESVLVSESRREFLGAMRTRIYLAILLEGTGNRSAQLRELDKAAGYLDERASMPSWALARIGSEYLRAGAKGKAERMCALLRRLVNERSREDRSLLHLLEGEIAAAAGRVEQGLELLSLADREGGTAETLAHLARAQERAGRTEAARVSYERLLKMGRPALGWEPQQDWLAARVRLARLCLEEGEQPRAAAVLEEFARLWRGADAGLPLVREAGRLRGLLKNHSSSSSSTAPGPAHSARDPLSPGTGAFHRDRRAA